MAVPSSGERDWEGELSAAFEADTTAEQAPAAPAQETPAGSTPTPDVQPPAVPGEPSVPDAQAPAPPTDTFDSGEFNPDLLAPELQPGWHQLQGAFTRKTQELAEQRRELEAMTAQFGDTDAVSQALQLHTAINDPSNWPQLYQELAGLMEANGIPMPGSVAPATPAGTPPAAQPMASAPEVDDPDLVPLMERINALQANLDAMSARNQEQAMLAHQEYERQQRVAQFEAQERKIRDLYPKYNEDDWNDIYGLAPFYGGDLVASQQHFEASRQRHVTAYLDGKSGAQDIAPATPPAGGTANVEPDATPKTLQEIGREAEEHLRQLQAAGEFDL